MSDASKDLNPNAKEFCPAGAKSETQQADPNFVMNPEAKPWAPGSK